MAKEIEKIEFPKQYRVLGADLSLRRPSFCLLDVDNEDEVRIKKIEFKTVDNKTTKKKCHGQLLDEIREAFTDIYKFGKPIFAVRENEIMKVKVPSERSLSKVVGLMDWCYWRMSDKEWYSIYPVTVKKLITGSGKATKEEVAKCLDYYLGKQNYKCDDESDAAAVAVAWLIQHEQIKQKEIS